MDWTALAGQAPIIAAFIWYAIKTNNKMGDLMTSFMTSLDKRDDEYEKRNLALVQAITKLSEQISQQTERLCTHDEVTRQTLVQLIPAGRDVPTQRRPKQP